MEYLIAIQIFLVLKKGLPCCQEVGARTKVMTKALKEFLELDCLQFREEILLMSQKGKVAQTIAKRVKQDKDHARDVKRSKFQARK